MFCSGCGQPLTPGQQFCAQCGRAAAQVPPTAAPGSQVPNIAFELANYATRVRALSTVWFIYGGLVLVTGLVGLTFASSFLNGGLGPWMRGPWAHGGFPFGPGFGPAILHFAWVMVILRAALAFLAGWGLMERAMGTRGGDRGGVFEHTQDSDWNGAGDLDPGDAAGVSKHDALRSVVRACEFSCGLRP